MFENTSTRIKELRKSHNMTIEQLADKVKLAKSTICRYERGSIASIKTETINEMCRIFNVTPAFLLGLDDLEKRPDKEAELISLMRMMDETSLDVMIATARALVRK